MSSTKIGDLNFIQDMRNLELANLYFANDRLLFSIEERLFLAFLIVFSRLFRSIKLQGSIGKVQSILIVYLGVIFQINKERIDM